jgi:hypothetical protein
MKLQGRVSAFLSVLFLFIAGGAAASETPDQALSNGSGDIYKTVFESVDPSNLQKLLKDMTGYNPVTVGGQTFSITDRYMPASKADFRKYWTAYYQSLGMKVNELDYKTQYSIETQGHDVEAILPGKSSDSVVIIVHYDSIGPHGADNPGVDDDMSGMSVQMETARILSQYAGHLEKTVRFVAADYEEWGDLEGARYYAQYILALSKQEGFKIVSAIDDEQIGWKEGAEVFDVFDCGGATDSTALGSELVQTASTYSKLGTTVGCMGENSDHYAMWEIGVPAVVFSEHDPFSNDHFDAEGGDTYDKIDLAYFEGISQVGVTFASRVVGIDP